METFKNRIKSARVNSGMSQQDLADRLGVTKQSVSQYERGMRKPDMETLIALGDVFNLSIDYLTGKSDVTLRFLTEEDLMKLAQPPKEITPEELALLEAFHAAPAQIQKAVLILLEGD